jgi:hypothetical protein
VPTIFVLALTWWARRKCAFAHPTDSIFKQPATVIPGHRAAMNPESRDSGSGPSDHPGMTSGYDSAISPHVLREVCQKRPALENEGAGNAGRSMRPQPGGQKKSHASR